jgi:hypothetical protein
MSIAHTLMVTEPEARTMNREHVLGEINEVLDNEIMTAEQLLGELLLSMETPELRENWEFIKRNWEICPGFFR